MAWAAFNESTLDPLTGHPINDNLSSIENVVGSNGLDTLIGDAGNNILDGRLGRSSYYGGGGSDTFVWHTDQAYGYIGDTGSDDFIQLLDFTTDDLSIVYVGGSSSFKL